MHYLPYTYPFLSSHLNSRVRFAQIHGRFAVHKMDSAQTDAGEVAPTTTNEIATSPPLAAPEVDAQHASLGEPEQAHERDRTRILEERQEALKRQLQKQKQKYRDLKQSHRNLQRAHNNLKEDHRELGQEVFELQEDFLELKARFDSAVRS